MTLINININQIHGSNGRRDVAGGVGVASHNSCQVVCSAVRTRRNGSNRSRQSLQPSNSAADSAV